MSEYVPNFPENMGPEHLEGSDCWCYTERLPLLDKEWHADWAKKKGFHISIVGQPIKKFDAEAEMEAYIVSLRENGWHQLADALEQTKGKGSK